ncbi:hypothetical protein Taro_041055 [Colocasia esculenta]|uniref:Uncharacterized protein n=1 Tax=Colocasia esculenta TaxID=4460 RepID=A0A843WSA1_COLES|nr:hypothetical protein [Colocasia esculenta]
MKVHFCVLICLLALNLHFSSSLASRDGREAPIAVLLSGRRLLNPSTSSSASRTTLFGDERKKQEHGMVERPGIKGDPERDQGADENSEEGLVYNVDYHGVITHPSPLPRHPKP